MQLTMAMGLKYDPGAGISLLTDFNSGQRDGLARSEESVSEPVGQVIDVEAVEVRERQLIQPTKQRHFDYLVYDLNSAVVSLPLVGSRLDVVT